MTIEPFSLAETSPGTFSLLLRDVDVCLSTFEAARHSGSGYSWEAVASHVVESEMEDVEERIEFNSEADMFCAYGADRAALERLGERLAELARHPRRLTKIVDAVPANAWDD